MKNLILSSALVLIASSAAQAQQAVQWRVEDGGNGHWYLLVALPGQGTTRIPWGEARSRSEAIGGHLATLTTAQESAFLWTNFNSLMIDNVWGSSWCCWLGGYRVSGQTFAWVTNEPYSCSVLCGSPCEGGGENALYTGQTGGPEFCVDFHGSTFQGGKPYYLVEFAQDCNGDGIVDYGQILDGTFPDANGNGVPDCCDGGGSCCPGDVASDGMVDGVDLAAVLSQWGTQGSGTFNADIDGSGLVDGGDLALVLSGWGPCPQ